MTTQKRIKPRKLAKGEMLQAAPVPKTYGRMPIAAYLSADNAEAAGAPNHIVKQMQEHADLVALYYPDKVWSLSGRDSHRTKMVFRHLRINPLSEQAIDEATARAAGFQTPDEVRMGANPPGARSALRGRFFGELKGVRVVDATHLADNRKLILDEAAEATIGRDHVYGPPERTGENVARLWRAHIMNRHGVDIPLDAVDYILMNDLTKTARLEVCPDHRDSWVDKAGYAASGGGMPKIGGPR